VDEAVAVQPRESVTVTPYVPGKRLLIEEVTALPGVHKYVLFPVPPIAVADTLPLELLLHVGLTPEVVTLKAGGLANVAEPVATHPTEFVTDTVKLPAAKLVAFAAVEPLLHR